MAEAYNAQMIARMAGDFVVKQRGAWSHEDWEDFCASVLSAGVPLNSENAECLGVLLETLKALYLSLPKRIKTDKKVKGKAKAKSKGLAKRKARATLKPQVSVADQSPEKTT